MEPTREQAKSQASIERRERTVKQLANPYSFSQLADLLGQHRAELVLNFRSVYSDFPQVIRNHAFLDDKVYEIEGRASYFITIARGDGKKVFPGAILTGNEEVGRKIRELAKTRWNWNDESKVITAKVAHDDIASLHEISPICRLRYYNITSEDLDQMGYKAEDVLMMSFETADSSVKYRGQ